MKQQIRIASFNLYNLVLPEVNYYGRRRYSQQEFNQKKAWINYQLDNMNGDIVGFQEIFHEEAIQQVVEENPNYRGARLIVAHTDGSGPAVGILSRFPITDYEVYTTFPEKIEVDGMVVPFERFSRPVVRARIAINDHQHINAFVAHLKSKRPMIPDDVEDRFDPLETAKGEARSLLLRAAESCALRSILLEFLQDREDPIVLFGDLNDAGHSVTTQIISGQQPFRHLPFEVKKKQWDTLLYHVKDIQARQSYRDVYYTHIHNGHYNSIDHIMVSEELVKDNPKHIGRVGLVQVFNDHLIDQTLSTDRVESWKSDHAQVMATIELRD